MTSSGRPKPQGTVSAQVFLRSVSGRSIHELGTASDVGDLAPFRAPTAARAAAVREFERLGFAVFEDEMGLALSIQAAPSVFRQVFGVTEAELREASARESFRLRVPDDLTGTVEDILLLPPPEFH
ncbi:MAG TPA: hypothetical protein VFO58_19220 [Vicinamibacterales bacterium]|nr:hypothetical protein [Vicinamibacterales bacterium]